MSVKTIQATVVDIRKDAPQATDELFVDTNSWRNLTYSRILNPKSDYLDYMKRALASKTVLYACGVTFLELASTIEKDEWTIFQATSICDKKMFRHGFPNERKRVVEEVRSSWAQVTAIATLVDLTLNTHAIGRCLKTFNECPVDGYDLLLVEAMERRNVMSILTDDSDFATVHGVRVFTANSAVIAAARNQGKLLPR